MLLGPKLAIEDKKMKVEVIKTLKANGENAQISWSDDADCWVIASKNVSLLAENKDQVLKKGYYTQDRQSRFFFAIHIALQWFEILDKIKKVHGPEKVDQLKKDLNARTMVGEYIGNQKF
jgi:hypothetical protein